ncbi:MAG: glycosyltransferase family 39 protein [Chloroflexi bacterium]|nr:glycosyltransferase family 39 protein [Chloroflexota bacterium]
MRQGHRRWLGLLAMAAALAVAFWLRWHVFSTEELGLDGHLAVGLALAPLGDMLAFNLRDVHPPLFYLLLGAWLQAAGVDFVTARWPAVAAGVLALPVLYQLGRRTLGTAAGLAAALLLAISPAHIFLSATVRDFGLGMLVSALALLVLLVLTSEDTPAPRVAWLAAALSLATAAALLTWYFHLLYLGLALAYLAWRRPRRWRAAVGAMALGAALALPWYAAAVPALWGKAAGGVTVSGEAPRELALAAFAAEAAKSLVGTTLVSWQAVLGYWALLVLAGLAFWWRGAQGRALAVGVAAGVCLGGVIAYELGGRWVYSTFVIRYFLVLLPFAVLAQAALLSPGQRTRQIVGVLALLVLALPAGLWYTDLSGSAGIPYEQDPGLGYLEPRLAAGDGIIFMDYARAGLYQLRGRGDAPSYVIHFAGSPFLADDVATRAAALVPGLKERHARVWFVLSQEDRQEQAAPLRQALGPALAEPAVVRDEWWWAQVTPYAGSAR